MACSSSPCAACKFLRRKCTQECVFAPYFPPDQPQKFANVHKVFGASNVAKLLNEISAAQREDAVNSLAYEAEARLHDPVYGCVGLISLLQHKLKQLQNDLYNAKKDLAQYIGPTAMLPILQPAGFMPQQPPGNPSSSSVIPYSVTGPSHGRQREPQLHQILEAQQLAVGELQLHCTRTVTDDILVAAGHQDMLRSYEHQQQRELARFSTGGFNQMTVGSLSPSLALGNFDSPYQIQEHAHHQLQPQLLLQPHEQQRSGSEEEKGRSVNLS